MWESEREMNEIVCRWPEEEVRMLVAEQHFGSEVPNIVTSGLSYICDVSRLG